MKSVGLKVATIYVLVGAVWIAYSDALLARMVHEPYLWEKISTLKGWGYVLVTGAMLYLLIVRYTAAQEKVREALEASEARFRSVFEDSPIGIAVARNGTLLFVNPACTRIFGAHDVAELAGQTAQTLVAPESRDELVKHFRLRAEGDSPPPDIETVGLRRDGTTFPCLVAATQVHISERPALLIFLTDLTDRKQLEARLIQAQKMEGIGRLAGGVAHDFNNILTAILGYADLVESASAADDRKVFVDGIRLAGERAANLTSQLLAFARKQVIEPTIVDINGLVSDMERMLQHMVGEDVVLRGEYGEGLAPVKVDPGQMEQVLMNLAVNARDAMPGGGTLTIETANVTLDDAYAASHPGVAPGPYVMIEVRDTGEGMTDEVRARAFEPFFTTKESGTGLGLATCFGIVKQASGHIALTTSPGQGAGVRVYLPPAPNQAHMTSAENRIPATGGSETILLAEDDPLVRDIEVRSLRSHGYNVLEAESGDAALAASIAHDGRIDLLLTDVVMPHMDGTQLASLLSSTRPGIRVLYMSGYSDSAVSKQGVLHDGVVLLQKPFTPEELLRKVREVLDGGAG